MKEFEEIQEFQGISRNFKGISLLWDANVVKTKEIQTFAHQIIEIPLKFLEIP